MISKDNEVGSLYNILDGKGVTLYELQQLLCDTGGVMRRTSERLAAGRMLKHEQVQWGLHPSEGLTAFIIKDRENRPREETRGILKAHPASVLVADYKLNVYDDDDRPMEFNDHGLLVIMLADQYEPLFQTSGLVSWRPLKNEPLEIEEDSSFAMPWINHEPSN